MATPAKTQEKITLAEQLAAFVVRSRYEDLSVDAVQQLKIHTLDAIGCALGAMEAVPLNWTTSEATI